MTDSERGHLTEAERNAMAQADVPRCSSADGCRRFAVTVVPAGAGADGSAIFVLVCREHAS